MRLRFLESHSSEDAAREAIGARGEKAGGILVPAGIRAIRAATQATRTIPIVVPFTSDLVGTGLIATLARPGGNDTGLAAMSSELTGKRLELLKEVLPKVSRVAVLWNSALGHQPQNRQVPRAHHPAVHPHPGR